MCCFNRGSAAPYRQSKRSTAAQHAVSLHVPRPSTCTYSEASQTAMQGRHREGAQFGNRYAVPSLSFFSFFPIEFALFYSFLSLWCVWVCRIEKLSLRLSVSLSLCLKGAECIILRLPSAVLRLCPTRQPIDGFCGPFSPLFFKKGTHTQRERDIMCRGNTQLEGGDQASPIAARLLIACHPRSLCYLGTESYLTKIPK